jgi:hypothetical protein
MRARRQVQDGCNETEWIGGIGIFIEFGEPLHTDDNFGHTDASLLCPDYKSHLYKSSVIFVEFDIDTACGPKMAIPTVPERAPWADFFRIETNHTQSRSRRPESSHTKTVTLLQDLVYGNIVK